jgi:energy-coupling factor transport system permease protein
MSNHTGHVVARIGPIVVHSEGIRTGLLYTLRVLCISTASFAYVLTTNPRDLVVGFVRLGVPYRYAWMLFLALLSIPALEAELGTIKEAQLIRGVRPARTRVQQQLELYARYSKSLLISALRRIENVSIAMDSRAFGAYPDRTFLDPFRWTAAGVLFATVWSVAFALGLYIHLR